MGYYADRADFETNLAFIVSNKTTVADIAGRLNMAKFPDGTPMLIACQGDVDKILAAIAALPDQVAAAVSAAVRQDVIDAVNASLPGAVASAIAAHPPAVDNAAIATAVMAAYKAQIDK